MAKAVETKQVHLPVRLHRQLVLLAAADGSNIQALVTNACEQLVSNHPKREAIATLEKIAS